MLGLSEGRCHDDRETSSGLQTEELEVSDGPRTGSERGPSLGESLFKPRTLDSATSAPCQLCLGPFRIRRAVSLVSGEAVGSGD